MDVMQQLSVRQQQILESLYREEYCAIEQLSDHFHVTSQTIRRDINHLCELGLARRHHGGVSLPATLSNRSYFSRQTTNTQEKQNIASRVAQLIPDGSTVFLGIGTTIAFIAEQLSHHQALRVVTNNFEAAHILSQYESVEIWLPEGKIRSKDRDIVGENVSEFFSQFSADIGIIGCAAVVQRNKTDLVSMKPLPQQHLVMEYELREAKVSQAILSHSQQNWLVATQAKWQGKANTTVADLEQFDQVFTSG